MSMMSSWRRFLHRPSASFLTHGSLAVLTILFIGLIWQCDFRWAVFPGVLLAHRIGVMLHEYIHGIPFRNYRHCLAVLALYDGLLLMFGLLELFRGTHLSHHRWLNREGDSGYSEARRTPSRNRVWQLLISLEATQHVGFYIEAWRGRHPYVRGSRMLVGIAGSLAWMGIAVALGRSDMIWKLVAIAVLTTAIPVSLRGAIEHHAEPGNPSFANDYRVWIPLFNLNRHVHHHEQPRKPWYLLEFRTPRPLSEWRYYTHWFRVYWAKELVLMKPMREEPVDSKASAPGDKAR